MAYLGSWKIDDALTFTAQTQSNTGAATDADSDPAYRVYENETATPILTGTMATLDAANTDGFYSEAINLSAANGFEKGKCYHIRITAVVAGVTGAVVHSLQIEAEVDANRINWANVDNPTTAVGLSGTSVLLTSGTGAGQVDLVSGTVKANYARTGTAQAGDATSITLDASASSVDNFYIGEMVQIVSGVGAGQSRVIAEYNGTTKIATIAREWGTPPNGTSVFAILANDAPSVSSVLGVVVSAVDESAITSGSFVAGAIDAAVIADGAIDSSTFAINTGLRSIRSANAQSGGVGDIQLDVGASSVDDFYVGTFVVITSGTGAGQSRIISDYDGTTKTASVIPDFTTSLDATSVFAIRPFAAVMLEQGATSIGQTGGEVQLRIEVNRLDHLVAVAASSSEAVDNSIIARLASKSATPSFSSYNNTTDSLEAIRDNFPTNFSTLAINGSGHISRVTLSDTITTYTGDTPQTGDSFARIGSTGSGLTSLAPSATALSTAVWTSTIAGRIDVASSTLATSAQAVKLLAASYDTATVSGSTITLSNGATQVVTASGRVTT